MASPRSVMSVPARLEARVDDKDSSTKEDVGRSSTQVGLIVGTLIAFGLLSFLLYLLYRKRADSGANPSGWWRRHEDATETGSLKISGPMMTPSLPSDERSTHRDVGGERVNESQRNLVPPVATKETKKGIVQKIRQALFGASQLKVEEGTSPGDMEKGQSSDALEARPSSTENSRASAEDWSQRPTSATEVSIQTQSSMALHPAVAQLKAEKKSELRPGKSAFSWSTTAPTPVPPSHPNMKENPLPPLPHDRDSRRDTALTTMSEDSQPVRHKSVNSWVANMQARQEKRDRRLEEMAEEEEEGVPELKLPSDGNADANSVRLSAMTDFSNMKTPALQTAQMAWHVHQMPGQVNVPSPPRSVSRGKNQGLGLQNQSHDGGEGNRTLPNEEHGELSQQEGESSREADHTQEEEYQQQDRYSEQEGEYLQDTAYSQQQDGQPQEEYSRQGEYSQQNEEEEEQGEYPLAYSEEPEEGHSHRSEVSQQYGEQQEQEEYPIQYDEQHLGQYPEHAEYTEEYDQQQQEGEYPEQAEYTEEYDQQQQEGEYIQQHEGDYAQQYYDAEEEYPQQQYPDQDQEEDASQI